jgi:putative FmdB family regulatory protein
MPIYCYECPNCQNKFEIFKAISKYDEKEKCNKCGTITNKMISKGVGVIFKGDGFYQTDYKNKGL